MQCIFVFLPLQREIRTGSAHHTHELHMSVFRSLLLFQLPEHSSGLLRPASEQN